MYLSSFLPLSRAGLVTRTCRGRPGSAFLAIRIPIVRLIEQVVTRDMAGGFVQPVWVARNVFRQTRIIRQMLAPLATASTTVHER
jgi:hypothetical protein